MEKYKTLKDIENNIFRKLQNKYKTRKCIYISFLIDSIIFNDDNHMSSLFKDSLIYNDDCEFIKKLYSEKDSYRRLKSFLSFYSKYTLLSPNFPQLEEFKYIHKNITHKEKILEKQLLNRKSRDNIKKFNEDEDNISNDKFFNSAIYNSIIKSTEDKYSSFLNINKDLKEEENEFISQVNNIISLINKENTKAIQNRDKFETYFKTQNSEKNNNKLFLKEKHNPFLDENGKSLITGTIYNKTFKKQAIIIKGKNKNPIIVYKKSSRRSRNINKIKSYNENNERMNGEIKKYGNIHHYESNKDLKRFEILNKNNIYQRSCPLDQKKYINSLSQQKSTSKLENKKFIIEGPYIQKNKCLRKVITNPNFEKNLIIKIKVALKGNSFNNKEIIDNKLNVSNYQLLKNFNTIGVKNGLIYSKNLIKNYSLVNNSSQSQLTSSSTARINSINLQKFKNKNSYNSILFKGRMISDLKNNYLNEIHPYSMTSPFGENEGINFQANNFNRNTKRSSSIYVRKRYINDNISKNFFIFTGGLTEYKNNKIYTPKYRQKNYSIFFNKGNTVGDNWLKSYTQNKDDIFNQKEIERKEIIINNFNNNILNFKNNIYEGNASRRATDNTKTDSIQFSTSNNFNTSFSEVFKPNYGRLSNTIIGKTNKKVKVFKEMKNNKIILDSNTLSSNFINTIDNFIYNKRKTKTKK